MNDVLIGDEAFHWRVGGPFHILSKGVGGRGKGQGMRRERRGVKIGYRVRVILSLTGLGVLSVDSSSIMLPTVIQNGENGFQTVVAERPGLCRPSHRP